MIILSVNHNGSIFQSAPSMVSFSARGPHTRRETGNTAGGEDEQTKGRQLCVQSVCGVKASTQDTRGPASTREDSELYHQSE